MQFENISIHCQKLTHCWKLWNNCYCCAICRYVMFPFYVYYLSMLLVVWLKQSLFMVIIVVLSEININFCGYSVVFCIKMVELRT